MRNKRHDNILDVAKALLIREFRPEKKKNWKPEF